MKYAIFKKTFHRVFDILICNSIYIKLDYQLFYIATVKEKNRNFSSTYSLVIVFIFVNY